MAVPFANLLAREQQVALISVIALRLSEAGFLSEGAASMEPAEVAHVVMGDGIIEMSESEALHRAAITKLAATTSTVSKAVKSAGRTASPVVRKTGRAAIDVASATGNFVFEVTREATKKMRGSVQGPACPKCGMPTVIKRNRKTHVSFAACSGWGDTGCDFTAGITFVEKP